MDKRKKILNNIHYSIECFENTVSVKKLMKCLAKKFKKFPSSTVNGYRNGERGRKRDKVGEEE